MWDKNRWPLTLSYHFISSGATIFLLVICLFLLTFEEFLLSDSKTLHKVMKLRVRWLRFYWNKGKKKPRSPPYKCYLWMVAVKRDLSARYIINYNLYDKLFSCAQIPGYYFYCCSCSRIFCESVIGYIMKVMNLKF